MPLTFGLQLPRFTWPGGSAEIAAHLAAIAGAAEEAGFASIWVMDHYLQIPQVGPRVGRDARGLHDARLPRRANDTARLGTLCTGHHLPQHRRPRQDHRHPRRAVRRAGDGRPRHRLVRARAPTCTGGTSRRGARRYDTARGRPAAAPAAVGQGITAVRGADDHRAGGDLLPPAAAGARPDPRRRVRRTSHAAPRRPLRRRLQPVRRRGDRAAQDRRAPPALRRRRPRSRRGDGDEPDVGAGDRRRRRTTDRQMPARSRSRSVATARTPRPACRRRSCRSPTSPRAASSGSPRCSPPSGR